MEKKLSYCELGLIPERYDPNTDTYHDAQEYVSVALLTRPINGDLIRCCPTFMIPLTVFCKPDVNVCKQFLPTKPIDIKFGNVKLDPQGPYVNQCFEKETKQEMRGLIQEISESPVINRAHKDYKGCDAPNPVIFSDGSEKGVWGEWDKSPNITLVIGKTASGDIHFRTLEEKINFGDQFKALTTAPIFPDIPFRCRSALLTTVWTLPTGDNAFKKEVIKFA